MSGADSDTNFVVLGAGPAGIGAALRLAQRGFSVDLVERGELVGGNAGSFELEGVRVDFGSHRLHPASDPEVLREIQQLLGEELLTRPRHGRIHLLGRWIHFPLRAPDMALRMPPGFAFGVGTDIIKKAVGAGAPEARGDAETFASVLERGLGSTICREFYFPYARKMWGLEPEEIDAEQAHKRVSAGSLGKMIRRLLPGGTGSGAANTKGIFYYPREGFGQISERLCEAAVEAGVRLHMKSEVHELRIVGESEFEVAMVGPEGPQRIGAKRVFSTIPSGVLARIVQPAAPEAVLESARSLELRAMLLVYLVLETDQFTEYDAHYFPGEAIPFTRLSEPKNYAARTEPEGVTVLCAEIPCSRDDDIWEQDEASLGELVKEGLAKAGLPVRCAVRQTHVRRLPAAYPIYRAGYAEHFDRLDGWIEGLEGVLSFGRQGLFAHDNTHHALFMANAAVASTKDDGSLDHAEWERYRKIFATHVVED